MENAGDALKMAAAMMIFAGALTITIFMFSKAREASTSIMAQSEKNRTYYNVDNVNITSEREVGVDTVISNLYSYYQTQNTIVFFSGELNDGKLQNVQKMSLYETKASVDTLKKSSLVFGSNKIFGLDINDEALREEQWINGEERRKQFVDFLVNKQNIPNNYYSTSKNRGIVFKYNFGGTSLLNSGARFIERTGEYNRDLETTDKDENNNTSYTDTGDAVGAFNGLSIDSSVVRFEGTDEVLDNSKGDKKKIIEYIYIVN